MTTNSDVSMEAQSVPKNIPVAEKNEVTKQIINETVSEQLNLNQKALVQQEIFSGMNSSNNTWTN